MKNQKKLLILIAILLVCIIIVIIALLMLRKETMLEEDNPTTLAFENTEKLDNKTLFFQIEQNIEKYLRYVTSNNQIAVSSISPNGAIQLKPNANYTTFLANEMYLIDKIDNTTVFVHEIARNYSIEDDYYLVISIDYENNAFEVTPSSKEEYENAINNNVQEKYTQDINILNNEYNSLEEENLTDFQILKKYFDDYKFKAINKPEIAFEQIDEEYRFAKFNNDIDEYKTYIKNNKELLQDANIVRHGITKEGQYGEYIFIDNNNNYYKLKETGIYEYTIILDNYTIESDELKKQYASLTNTEKIASNIDKVMKLINTKSYNTIYKYLNESFKNNYFPTIEVFTDYMNKNFFENNIVGNITMKNEGDTYILTVPYKESLSTAAEERTKTFMIRLKEGTNFELSFEV